ncbi:hypothetical protein PhCBS80983_g03444 [Powellomyces hirtus]|uniref:Glycoside hydrolase family 5 domain-containing protein n=1 Tax=Powellomyces hirtus TaxID=109895 RepID=A0A507E4E2_9FUNG|nr:hypothetical protein PhCBS80983_g03444 [Powellomyces hirtus]
MTENKEHEPPTITKLTSINTTTGHLLDSQNRTRIFHGVNVVYKRPPYHPPLTTFSPIDSFTPLDARILSSLNINCIRLGVHWAGAEPTRGEYDAGYFAAIRAIVRMCAAEGIYVLLEFHQDVLARQFGGHGVPDWLVGKDWLGTEWWRRWRRFAVPNRMTPVKTDENGMPGPEDMKGLTWYLLYSNHDGLLDAFAAFWKRVVEEFRHEPNVIGYEVMNEPWSVDRRPGNHWKNPLLLLPGYASRTTLHTMHTHVASSIRVADPDALIYFEGATWDIHSKARSVPGGITFANRSVLAYHHYKPPQRAPVDTVMARRTADAHRLGGCGVFCTEWEMWFGDGNTQRVEEMWTTVEAADRHLHSWAGWAYKSFAQGSGSADGSLWVDQTGERRRVYEELWSRTFASAVGGDLVSMHFDRTTAAFELVFKTREGVAGPTEMEVVPRVWYPTGFAVHVQVANRQFGDANAAGDADWDPVRPLWRVVDKTNGESCVVMLDTPPHVPPGTRVTVRIERTQTEGQG